MSRLFLSGQMTCAMLLGAGLLLRAQAALRPEPPAAVEEPHTRPAELMSERARTPPRIVRSEAPAAPRVVQRSTHPRKGFTHGVRHHRGRKCGVRLAGRWFRCG